MQEQYTVVPVRVGNSEVHMRVSSSEQLPTVGPQESEMGASPSEVAAASFDAVTDGLEAMCQKLGSVLEKVSPTRANIEFSVGVKVDAGKVSALFFDSKAEGAIKVGLEWTR